MRVHGIQSDLSQLDVSARLTKTENTRVYECNIFMKNEKDSQSLLFWSPQLKCKMKDSGHLVFDLPSNDESEEFYTFLNNVDSNVVSLAQKNWVKWFGKDYPGDDDIADRYRTNIKVGSKDECLRMLHTKVSPHIKCRINNEESSVVETPFTEDVKQISNVRALIELKRIVIGRSNFKGEYVVHQLLLPDEPEIEELHVQQYSSETDWINL